MIDPKGAGKQDPVKRQGEKGLEGEEHSPMDPPGAYSQGLETEKKPWDFSAPVQRLMEDHQTALAVIDGFEKAIVAYKQGGYQLQKDINDAFGKFFKALDEKILPHNRREEKTLFRVLHPKLLEAGEHSKGEKPLTAVDVMEDDHVKVIQLGSLAFNLLGLSARLADERSRIFVLDTAYETSRELVELLKLHIHREDVTLFPLAQKLISREEFDQIMKDMEAF